MTKEDLQKLKEEYVNHLKSHIVDSGGMFTHIALFGNKKENDEQSLVHIVVDPKFLTSDEDKDRFITNILPDIIKKVREQFTVDAVAWTSEAWLRKTDKDFKGNWQEVPVEKEVLIIMYQEKETSDTMIYEIKRDGQVINAEGNLIDNVNLIELKDLEDSINQKGHREGKLHDMMKLFI